MNNPETASPSVHPPTSPPPGSTATLDTQFPRPGTWAPPAPKAPRVPTALHRNWVVAVLAVGVIGAFGLSHAPWANLGGAAILGASGIGLLMSGWLQTRASRLLVALGMSLAALLALRTDPFLVTFNLIGAISCLTLGAAFGRRTPDLERFSFWDFGPGGLLNDLLEPVVRGVGGFEEVPGEIGARIRKRKQGATNGRLSAILTGVSLGVPMVAVLAALLASADPVFASFFEVNPPDIGGFMGKLVLGSITAIGMAVLLRIAASKRPHPKTSVPNLGWLEASIVLGFLVALFSLFAFSQFIGLTDAGDDSLSEIGLRYKQNARQGFFQLLVVAALTLGIVTTLHTVTRTQTSGKMMLRNLSAASISLTLFIVGVAFYRIQRYVGDDGLTPLRFYSSTASLIVGAAFVLTLLRVLDVKPASKWLTPSFLVLGVSSLFVLNLINPEKIMAEHNIERNEESILYHMEKQTSDGDVATFDGIDRLDEPLRSQVLDKLCASDEPVYAEEDDALGGTDQSTREATDRGFLSWNYAESEATKKRNAICR